MKLLCRRQYTHDMQPTLISNDGAVLLHASDCAIFSIIQKSSMYYRVYSKVLTHIMMETTLTKLFSADMVMTLFMLTHDNVL